MERVSVLGLNDNGKTMTVKELEAAYELSVGVYSELHNLVTHNKMGMTPNQRQMANLDKKKSK